MDDIIIIIITSNNIYYFLLDIKMMVILFLYWTSVFWIMYTMLTTPTIFDKDDRE